VQNNEMVTIRTALQSIFKIANLEEFDNLQFELDNLNLIDLSFVKSQIL
jgi:hypothetical protein